MSRVIAAPRALVAVAAAGAAVVTGVGLPPAGEAAALPHPPRIAWTALGRNVTTDAFTFCWTDADGTRGLCSDGIPPTCTPPGVAGERLLVPEGRAVRIRAVLRFRPRTVDTEAYDNDGSGRRWRRAAARAVDIRVGPGFEGRVGVFAVRAGAAGGDAAYAVCVIRVAVRTPS